jgi:hypothetical protein
MSQVALFSYATGAGFQCAVEYNNLMYVGTLNSIVKLNPLTGAVIDSKSYPVGVRGAFGFLSAGKIGTTGFFVTSLGTLISVDLTQSLIVDTVIPGVADTDTLQKHIAIDGTTVYVASFVSASNTLAFWRRFPTDSGAPLASQNISTDNILYYDSAPLAVTGGKIYLPGGNGVVGLVGFVYTFTIASNTITQHPRPMFSRLGYTSTLLGTTLFLGGARLVKDVYTWNTLTDTETGGGLVETNPADNGMIASTNDGSLVYMLNYANTSLQPKFWTLNPSLQVASSVAMDPGLTARPVVMLYSADYIYIAYTSQKTSVWFVGPAPPPAPVAEPIAPFARTFQNIHLPSGNDIVPYSKGAVVPPAIPPIPARTIENIKLPNGPKDYRYCRPPVLPYRNVPEPASYPSNPGQRRVCLVEGERPVADSGSPLQTYVPGQGVVQVSVNQSRGSRVAATWPPSSTR